MKEPDLEREQTLMSALWRKLQSRGYQRSFA